MTETRFPTLRRMVLLLALALIAPGAAPGLRAQDDLKSRAEAAFTEDRYPEAIALYEQVVAANPSDLRATKRLALLYSWENRLDESIATWDRVLASDPKDDEARRERAKIQSWDGRYADAEAGYRELIRDHPDDATLKLSLAEMLGWQGKYAQAREIYQPLIDGHDHAVEAAAGMGDLAAWEGNSEEAARWYRQVLKVEPNNEKAALGLARVHHWQGKDRIAVQEVDQAVEKFPKSREARKLQEEIHEPLRPYLIPSWDRMIDTDTNDVITTRLTGNIHTDPQTTLDFILSRYDARFVCDVAGHCPGIVAGALPTDPVDDKVETEGNSFATVYNTRFSDVLFVNARLGVDRQDGFDGDDLTRLVGGGNADVYPTPKFGFGFGLSRESLFDTARIIDNHLRIHVVSGRTDYRFLPRWRWRASAQHAWFNDDNERNVFNTSVDYRVPLPRPRLRLTYAFRWLDYAKNLDSGYFDPEHFKSHLLTAAVADELFHRRFYYAVEVTGGVQSFTEDGVDSGTDTVFGYELLGGWNIRRHLAFEATYGRSDYAQQVASGFESHHWGTLFKITF